MSKIINYIQTKKEFAENIKFVRESLELSQHKVADKLNIERSTYTYLETGKTEINIFKLIELENIFDVYIDDLISKNMNLDFKLLKADGAKPKYVTKGRNIIRKYVKNKKELAENLKFFRTNAGLTQAEMAKQLVMDRSTYAYYETEKTTPKLLFLIKIANIFGIEFYELITRDDLLLSRIVSKKISDM